MLAWESSNKKKKHWGLWVLSRVARVVCGKHSRLLYITALGTFELQPGHHITSNSVVSNPAFLHILKRSCERVKIYYIYTEWKVLFLSLNVLQSKKHDAGLTFSNNWYFIIRWMGLISRSVICNLWPNRCFRSWWKIQVLLSLGNTYHLDKTT